MRDGSGEVLTGGRRGGVLTAYQHQDFQLLDPGEAYSFGDYEVVFATQRPLYSYLPDARTVLSPDLAAGPPSISADGRTVTVRIKRRVRFSPPVDREVTSRDVEYAIERGANPNVGCAYFDTYFALIVGARGAKGGGIRGISTPDRYTIAFHLTGSYGTFFAQALSLPLTAPVPREFAARLDAHSPTLYGSTSLVSTGPYMLAADPRTGRFLGVGYTPGVSATLVRNPNWNRASDRRPAYLDRIEIRIGGDPGVIGLQVLTSSHAVQTDTPASDVVQLAYQRYRDQLVAVPGSGLDYVTLDNRHGPFRSPNLRKALWAGLDRREMVVSQGGVLAGDPGTHFIYPGSPGFDLAGGRAGPPVDYNRSMDGSPSVATKYMRLAGYRTGRYTGPGSITVVGLEGHPYDRAALIVEQTLIDLGFRTRLRLVGLSVYFTKFCGVPAQEIDVCPNASWARDFADPQTILDPTFAGYHILAAYNPNSGQVDDPQINAAMRAAEPLLGVSARARAWARIDAMLVDRAVAVPWMFVRQPNIESRDVRGVNDLWSGGTWDYAYSSLR